MLNTSAKRHLSGIATHLQVRLFLAVRGEDVADRVTAAVADVSERLDLRRSQARLQPVCAFVYFPSSLSDPKAFKPGPGRQPSDNHKICNIADRLAKTAARYRVVSF